ncbi:MAG: GNAT family N-acetyltransferase, partial [Candidatus Competibacterales bacterium]|nr:GNAT family N-acetyltransferase [Candidatus Competibacterales bacterium]
WRNGPVWWIQSVYVVPEWRRRGAYRRLYRHVRELADAQGSVRGFRLYVERDNQVAQRTYRQLGMRESGYTLFEDMAD